MLPNINYNIYSQTVKITDNYFGKVVLFLVLAIASFFTIKHILPERLFDEQVAGNENIVMDSLMITAVNDTMNVINSNVAVTKVDTIAEIVEVDAAFDPTLSADGYRNLNRFYAKLEALENNKSRKIRIAYFGDSMNDGDYIVQDFRTEFQDKYGGRGVGFVPFTSLSSGARGSIGHFYSKNWITQSFVKINKPSKPFGVDGQVFFAPRGANAWISFKAQNQKHSTALNSPTLFYGKSGNSVASISSELNGVKDSLLTEILNPEKLLNSKRISGDLKSLKVTFSKADSIPFYGFNFDDGKGVHVDNFSIRGNSGLPLSVLNPSLMNAFDRELGYDLLVLHYGANVLGYGKLNYSWYEKNMTTVVKNLRACFPNADILIISTADKASRKEGVMKTDPAVVPLANSQKNYARITNSGYINLYSLMGGEGSMVKWVDQKMAGKDYTHFNGAGSKKIAGLIYGEIENGYAKYKRNK